MALQGNLDFWNTRHDGTYTDVEITHGVYPDGHKDKDKEGTTEIIQEPNYEEYIEESFTDVYVLINMSAIHINEHQRISEMYDENGNPFEFIGAERGETKDGYRLHFRYNIYASKNDRLDYFYNPIKEKDIDEEIIIEDLSLGGKNLIEYCYDYLKAQKGFENLKDI